MPKITKKIIYDIPEINISNKNVIINNFVEEYNKINNNYINKYKKVYSDMENGDNNKVLVDYFIYSNAKSLHHLIDQKIIDNLELSDYVNKILKKS